MTIKLQIAKYGGVVVILCLFFDTIVLLWEFTRCNGQRMFG